MLLAVRDEAIALELDVALAARAQQAIWHDVQNHGDGNPDWFVSLLLLVMQLV